MENIKRVSFLKKVNIFTETPEELLHQIAENLIEMEFSRGDHIVLKGELGDSMYIVIDGLVKVHDGDYIFSVLKKGDVFGKYYLLDRKERSATVTALEQTQLFCFKQEIFYEITRNEGTIIQGILRELVRRLRDMNLAEEQMAIQNQEIIRQKETLEKQKKELLELNATKDKFFSIIAHDLKSPFTSIVGYSEILKDYTANCNQQETVNYASIINTSSKQTLQLLENLLDWARLQQGRIVFRPQNLNLHELAYEVVDLVKDIAEQKGISVQNTIPNTLNVYADKEMIKTVLRNLVSNAIKFTDNGGFVEISSKLTDTEVFILVTDNGVGISADDIGKLFDISSNFSRKGTNEEKGTGLGLSLCKEFVEKNGGTIGVTSESGVGSVFRFTLPLSPSDGKILQ